MIQMCSLNNSFSRKVAPLTLLLLLSGNYILGQRIAIPIVSKYGDSNTYGAYMPTGEIKVFEKYSLKNATNYKLWKIRKLIFDSEQAKKEYILLNKKTHLNDSIKSALPSTGTVDKTMPRNSVAILVGIDRQNRKNIVIDANNNLDFNDDSTYIFNNNDSMKTYPMVNIEFDYLDGVEIKTGKVPYTIDAYDVEDEVDVSFINKAYKEGILYKGRKKYIINITNQYYDLVKNRDYSLNIRSIPVDSTVNNNYRFKNGELIDFDGRDTYKIDSLTKDSLYLSFQYRALYDGAKVNSKAPGVIGNDYINGKQFSLYAQKGSYVVIDFWGSWCGPCIKALPDLVALRNKYKRNGVQVVSLAYDGVADIPKLKEIIVEKKLDWNHVLLDKKGKQTTLVDYKVQAFPSIFLIDPKGMVLIRGEGKEMIDKIDQYLEGALKRK